MASSLKERRNRVVFNLPLNGESEEAAVIEIVDYLKEQRHKNMGIGGFTLSDLSMPIFNGYWWSDDKSTWMEDGIVICMLDYIGTAQGTPVKLQAEIAKLKKFIIECYAAAGSPQEEVWVVVHPIGRVA